MHQNTFGLFVVCARADTHCTLVGAFFFLNAVSFEFELAGGGCRTGLDLAATQPKKGNVRTDMHACMMRQCPEAGSRRSACRVSGLERRVRQRRRA
jgi:hypothetical protein